MFKIMLIVFRFLNGYVRLSVRGGRMERLFNMYKNSYIDLWDMQEKGPDTYEFKILVKDLKKTVRLFKKTNSGFKVTGRYGLPFILFKNRHKKLMCLGAAVSFFIIYYMSGFIWTINISGNYSYTYSQLIDVLDDIGIYNGVKKKNVDGEAIEKYLRNKYFDINWVSVEIKGTIMNINIKENFDAFISDEIKNPCDIVATRDGVINSIVTRNGVPVVKAGDTVKAGDVLISGTVDVLDDYGEVLSTRYEAADGDIYIDTTYEYKDTMEKKYDKRIYTGREKSQFFINIFNELICIKAGKVNYNAYDIVTEEIPLSIGEDFNLPAGLYVRKIKEVSVEKAVYDDEQLAEKSKERLDDYVKKLRENGAINIECNVVTTDTADRFITEGSINVTEPAIKYRDINSQ